MVEVLLLGCKKVEHNLIVYSGVFDWMCVRGGFVFS